MASATLPKRDQAFFEAVYELLDKSFPELKEKYGIWRVHNHFPIKESELFHETSNPDTRESTLRIIKKDELPSEAFASAWKLSHQGPLVATWCCDSHPEPQGC